MRHFQIYMNSNLNYTDIITINHAALKMYPNCNNTDINNKIYTIIAGTLNWMYSEMQNASTCASNLNYNLICFKALKS